METKEATGFLNPNVVGSPPPLIPIESASCQPQQHPKESHICPWLGCGTSYKTISDFQNHTNREHDLNRESMLIFRVQLVIQS